MDSQGSWEGATVYGNLLTCWIFSSSKEVIFNWHTVVSLIFSFESIRVTLSPDKRLKLQNGTCSYSSRSEVFLWLSWGQKTENRKQNNLRVTVNNKEEGADGEERNLEKHGPRLQHQEKRRAFGAISVSHVYAHSRVLWRDSPPALPDITDPSWELVWLRLLSALTGPVSLGTHQTQVNINIRLSRNRKQKSF